MVEEKAAEEGKLTRREFLFGSAGFTAGMAMASGGLGMLSGCLSQPEERVVEVEKIVEVKTGGLSWPMPYEKIDPKRAADIAYENWYKDFCSYGVVSGVMEALAEKVGEPYTSFPSEAFRGFHGGAVGWGTLCGTLAGTGIVTGLIAGKDGEAIFNDVIYWYSKEELPTYMPDEPKVTIKYTNKANSPLCHVSVGKWMKKENVAFFSPERKERCARCAASVAAKTVELLNAWKDGTYSPAHGSQAKNHDMTAQNNCGDCHNEGVPDLPGT
jgi:hypothetical protein